MASVQEKATLKAALLVVDLQEDFCPPDGTLAVAEGRDIATVINSLLELPFTLKIATRDFHPRDHVSFDTSHQPPKKAFESSIKITNPSNQDEEAEIPIWPAHCVQGTKGSEIIPELDVSKLDHVIYKGMDERLEMFSGFADVFGCKSSRAVSEDLADLLGGKGITHVFVVGLAGDYCVKCTAIDAQKEGFQVFVVDEATRSVNSGPKGWGIAKMQLEDRGIRIVSAQGPEVAELKTQA